MISSAIIVFREILEIALVVGIVSSILKGKENKKYILYGLGGGAFLSLILALLLNNISSFFIGSASDILNAVILLVAIFFIGWTIVWMNVRGRQMVGDIKSKSDEINQGKAPKMAISLIIGSAMVREGAEIVLFLYGLYIGGNSFESISLGFILGFMVAVSVGLLIYIGLIQLSQKYIFKVTSFLLILLAAGMATKIPVFLSSADILDIYSTPLWDSSKVLSEQTIFGQILSGLIGYTHNPSGMQLIFYVSTIVIILLSIKIYRKIVK